MFLTLAGVTLLFTQAQQNGTLTKVAERALRLCRGNAGLVPVMFFVLGCTLASVGPGHIATTALIAPMAMTVAARARIPAFLMAIMVGHGATSGSLSPVAPTGIIVAGIMTRIGLPGHEWATYANNLVAQTLVAFAGYLHLRRMAPVPVLVRGPRTTAAPAVHRFDRNNWITLVVIAALLLAVLVLRRQRRHGGVRRRRRPCRCSARPITRTPSRRCRGA